jgi:hypothetical protein
MPIIEVDGATAALLHESRDIINDMIAGRMASKTLLCPRWNPDGTEVKSVQEAAVLMGTSEEVAARAMLESDLDDEAKIVAFDFLEEKAIRRVRTPAGVKKFGQPIGTIIVRDGLNLTKVKLADKNTFDGAETVIGPKGERYAMVQDEDGWGAYDESVDPAKFWDSPVVTAKNEEDLLVALDKKLGGGKAAPKGKAPATDKKPASKPDFSSMTDAELRRFDKDRSNDEDLRLAAVHELTDRRMAKRRAANKPIKDGVTPTQRNTPADKQPLSAEESRRKRSAVPPAERGKAKLAKGRKLLDDGYDNPDTWENYIKGLSDDDRDALFTAALHEDDKAVIRAVKKVNTAKTSRAAGSRRRAEGN